MNYLGIDTGGTFTDFVLWQNGRIKIHKVLSTPDQPEKAILKGIHDLGLSDFYLVHGSTVATNAVLENKGVKTVLISNRGFADLLRIGRQNRSQLYELRPIKTAPPIPAEYCLETGGRLDAQGQWIDPLTEQDIRSLRQAIDRIKPQSVAVNLLFSWLNDQAERRIKAALPDLFVSLSSEVLPEIKEYERGMATWLNAWIGPLVHNYLNRLQKALPDIHISVMQSNTHTVSASQASKQAVNLLLSGPAGGLIGAQFSSQKKQLLSFDMGGTSTDVALIDGQPRLTTEGKIADYPVAVPMVDMQTIGAGGGSIAWLDQGGMLQVGPQSAGADPGPACYGRGGQKATVTDAHVVLGRLPPDLLLGGYLPLKAEKSQQVIKQLADAMSKEPIQTAKGIIQIANAHMARALRSISVQKGVDPQHYYLVSFGGAGGLHVCDLADALRMKKAIVPVQSGVLSALGLLAASPGRHYSHTDISPLFSSSTESIQYFADQLIQKGRAALAEEGHAMSEALISLDLRYQGQSYYLNIPWQANIDQAAADFEQMHQKQYGHRLERAIELVNIRVEVKSDRPNLSLSKLYRTEPAQPIDHISVAEWHQTVPIYDRQKLARQQIIQGPAIIIEQVATTWLAPDWQAQLDQWGNLLLNRHQ